MQRQAHINKSALFLAAPLAIAMVAFTFVAGI